MKLYRDFLSQEEIDAEYNIGAASPDMEDKINWYIEQSEQARQTMDCHLNVKFGQTLDETVDIFPAKTPGSPVLVFIHGGYWRMLSSKEFSFIARGFVPHDITVVVTNYSLCPKVSITEITRQNRAVIAWLYNEVSRFNGDPNRIIVAGHSAGGQQAAMLASTDWQYDYGLPESILNAVVAISGVYDLQPLRYSYLQPVLMLSHEIILQQSPCFNIPDTGPELLITLGEGDLPEFHRQAKEYADAWRSSGLKTKYLVHPGKDHFTVINDLGDPESPFTNRILSLL